MARFSHEATATFSERRTAFHAWLLVTTLCLTLQLAHAEPETPGTLYLHSTSSTATQTKLFLNDIAPTSGSAKYKNSPAISFEAGNPWREIGRWTSEATWSVPQRFSSADVWVGLNAADDPTAAFDVRALVSRNGRVVAMGEALCIDDLSRMAAAAKRVTVSLTPTSYPDVTGRITLHIAARVGTNPGGGRCRAPRPEPSAATGLRLYFDSTSRPAALNLGPSVPSNSAPVVSAGPNQTITLPANATLAGVVTDDGLPAGAAVTSAWTMTSGPGTVTFANTASPATTASFSAPGPYVLRLTASDTSKTAFAEVTITVNAATPANQPPHVDAGADMLIALVTGIALVSLMRSPLYATERKPLPDFSISALDGSDAQSASLVTEGAWLLMYVEMGCAGCDTLIRTVAEEHASLASRVVIVIGGVNAAAATKLAGAFPTLAGARWYADRSNALATALRTAGAPAVYGLRGNMLEWSLLGVVPDETTYRSTLVSWVGRP